MEPKKTIYYRDALNDDFSGSNFPKKHIDSKTHKYIRTNWFYRLLSFFIYRFFALPIAFIVTQLGFNVHVKNKKVLRQLKGTGYFLYGNHTRWIDMAIPYVRVAPFRRVVLVSNPAAVGLKGLGSIVNMLGVLPLPQTYSATKDYLAAMKYRLDKKQVVAIYPEAHIWPFYTGIRPFLDTSFGYPVMFNKPIVVMTTVYKPAFFFPKHRKPRMVVYLDGPFYPNQNADRKVATKELRDQAYNTMVATASRYNQCEYYRYQQRTDE